MRLPWDKQYLKISFHVIFTLIVIFGIGILIKNIIPITVSISLIISKILSILSPFFLGIAIAYLLDPLVNNYQDIVVEPICQKIKDRKLSTKKTKNIREKVKKEDTRTCSTLLTYTTVIFVIVLMGAFVSTSFGNHKGFRNMDNVVIGIRTYANSFNDMIYSVQQSLEKMGFLQEAENIVEEFTSKIGGIVQNTSAKIIEGITKAGNKVVDFAMALVISFYLLKDKKKFINFTNKFLETFIPDRVYKNFKSFWVDVDYVLSGYIRGQLMDSFIMGVLIGISVAIIGIDFPIIIGIIAGISNIIPYFGPIIGMIPAALMGLISGNPMKALYAVITLFILQQIDGAIIAPKIVGESVDVHPVAIVVAIIAGGSLFGLVGMLLAVPVAALLKLIFIRYIDSKAQEKSG
ncbi:MAG: AI-2E family transporter [Epulopiscium sp.]|nr:AI-2E family transporter [Candidatus Epulonipiscium sp.]